MSAIRTILHPTDLSEASSPAFTIACSLANTFPARLVILHVDSPRQSNQGEAEFARQEVIEQDLIEKVRARKLVNAVTHVEYRVVKGDPTKEILLAAENIRADFIVMGTHGHSEIRRLVMGSVAESVNRKATCPVLTVGGNPRPNQERAVVSMMEESVIIAEVRKEPEDGGDAVEADDPSYEVKRTDRR